jgi:UDP-N-acetylmuramate--alanine ligase
VNNFDNIQNVYFLGIGGIGMSALARYFMASGMNVAGYDRTPTGLTDSLINEGMAVHFDDSPASIPIPFRSCKNTLVVFTPAIPGSHSELAYFKKNGFRICKRSEILGLITRHKKTIAVAGTHGKTTISTMLAHILNTGSQGCSAFLGGISKNFNSNLVLNPLSEWVVAEADEFDRSFLQLYPYAAVITAIDPDHLDIYGNTVALQKAFDQFISQVQPQGIVLAKDNLAFTIPAADLQIFRYALKGKAQFHAENIRLSGREYHFDLVGPDLAINDITLIHPGLVNVENAVAASSMAALLGFDHATIREALGSFTGIQRRFDVQIQSESMIYIDDYAHHPKEIEATIVSVRNLFPDKKITGVFQPHLYSRTRDLAVEFASSLNLLDHLILLDIYPARELPIEGVTSELIFRNVTLKEKIMCPKDHLLENLKRLKIEVLLTMGAGDIDKMVIPIKDLYLKK